ncbi:MAG: DUF4041 domain-containing protein [Rikenellaceae bacterium]
MGFFDFLKQKELLQIKELQEQIALLSKYQNVVDTDKLIESKLAGLSVEEEKHKEIIAELTQKIEDIRSKYSSSKGIYDELLKKIDIFSESLELAEYGVYDPHFDFDTPESYKEAINKVREEQKQHISNGTAATGGETITWNDSLSQGQAMVKRQKKLMLRAFNGECDSFVASVSWNNAAKMQERIAKSFDAINKVYEKQGVSISSIYKCLKVRELQLSYEYKLKRQEEKEEQRAIREQMREEEKAAREFEAARLKAEKEEANYQKALDKARAEIASLEGDKQQKMQAKIDELESRLKEAEENKERALSMAQQTKRGHVYVISNMGSFGEDVYKIGMTRRLDPFDRVTELGDASVPFKFDVHAMIFSENAPALENKLHKIFDAKRLNLVNHRREFFNVTLDEIEKIVIEENGSIEFTKIAQASEYRESKAIRDKITNANTQTQSDFPDTI